MYITRRKTDDQRKFDARSRHPKLVLWDSPVGWGVEGGGFTMRIQGMYVSDSC